MKKFFSKIRNKVALGAGAAATAIATATPALAVTVVDNLDATTVVGKILDYLLTAGQLVGGGVIIYAFISFALSISQDNPDQRSRAIMFFVAGAMLVAIKTILKAIGVIA